MKLSALLLSVNIAASLPIAFCQMAPAAEEGVADTGDWLKSNLASIKKGKADIPTSRLKVTIPEKISSGDKSFDAYVARLKPMHKVSKLPSQRDLDMQLVAQTPRMAVDPSQLAGNISQSQYSDYPAPRAAYRQPQTLANMVPAGLSNAGPGSLRDNAVAMARQAIAGAQHMGAAPSAKNIKNAKRASKQSLQQRMDDWLGEPQGDEKIISQAGASLVQAPVMPQNFAPFSAKEADIDRQLNAPIGNLDRPQQQGTAGPAPFPLNLVPEAQLKNFIRGGRGGATPAMGGMNGMGNNPGMNPQMSAGMGSMGLGRGSMRPSAPKAYFGSWHGGGQQHLPKAGFQSNIHSSGFAKPRNVVQMRPSNRYSKGPKVVAVRQIAPRAAAPHISAAVPPATATYGSYHSTFRAGTY